MKLFKISLIILLFYGYSMQAQSIKLCDFQYLSKVIKPAADTLKIVNFWATWCKPCVEELKYFKQAMDVYKDKKVKFIFVSLDFSSQKNKVEEFRKKQSLEGSFYILSDDPNKWINKIDPEWAGDIPYTFIPGAGGKVSKINKSIQSFEELNLFIKSHLKK